MSFAEIIGQEDAKNLLISTSDPSGITSGSTATVRPSVAIVPVAVMPSSFEQQNSHGQ